MEDKIANLAKELNKIQELMDYKGDAFTFVVYHRDKDSTEMWEYIISHWTTGMDQQDYKDMFYDTILWMIQDNQILFFND